MVMLSFPHHLSTVLQRNWNNLLGFSPFFWLNDILFFFISAEKVLELTKFFILLPKQLWGDCV
jgi:hypothetical protein